MKVKDLMARQVSAVPPSASIVEVAGKMRDYGFGVVPVCENGRFRGVITKRDIVIGVVAPRDHNGLFASMLIHQRYPTVSPDVEALQAAKMMAEHSIQVLPIVQSGKFMGLITSEDLAQESSVTPAPALNKAAKHQVTARV